MRFITPITMSSEDYRNIKWIIAICWFSIGVIVGLGLATFIMMYESGAL
jgi:hypothetical protein